MRETETEDSGRDRLEETDRDKDREKGSHLGLEQTTPTNDNESHQLRGWILLGFE